MPASVHSTFIARRIVPQSRRDGRETRGRVADAMEVARVVDERVGFASRPRRFDSAEEDRVGATASVKEALCHVGSLLDQGVMAEAFG